MEKLKEILKIKNIFEAERRFEEYIEEISLIDGDYSLPIRLQMPWRFIKYYNSSQSVSKHCVIKLRIWSYISKGNQTKIEDKPIWLINSKNCLIQLYFEQVKEILEYNL